jgi:tRNA U34 2-thiouridine synthase MnmA/TrmU
MKRKALALFSGGLDSILVVRLMQEQGIDVEAITFSLPFTSCSGDDTERDCEAARIARQLGIPITIIRFGSEFLELIRNPLHGYGKGVNPCIDCRIHMLVKAREQMMKCGADFIITGEVLGQRPMSQRYDAMRVVERESGLEGLLLRPLSARHFEPTIPEQEDWVDRERLPAIKGRSRKEQMRLATELGVKEYPTPGGGCLLTEVSFAPKVRDLFGHCDRLYPRDFRLLRIGRHFRLGEQCKLIIGRDERENQRLEQALQQGETTLRWMDGNTPLGMLMGNPEDEQLDLASRLLLRYTRAEAGATCRVRVTVDGRESIREVAHTVNEEELERYRID